MLLSLALTEYQHTAELARFTRATLSIKKFYAKQLLGYAGDVELDALTPDFLRMYLAHHQQRGIRDNTYYGYFKHLRSFILWCYEQELLDQNPLRKFPRPRMVSANRPVLNESQIYQLYQVLARDKTKIGLRNLTIAALLLGTGIRSAECAALQISDVDLISGYILVRLGKGRKMRPVPISQALHKFLWRYTHDYRAHLLPPSNSARYIKVEQSFFINEDYAPLAATGLQTLMRRLLHEIGVSAATHIFRHSFANEYIRADGSVEKLRRILGHVSLDTTQQYVHLLPGDLLAHRTDVDPLEAPLFYFRK